MNCESCNGYMGDEPYSECYFIIFIFEHKNQFFHVNCFEKKTHSNFYKKFPKAGIIGQCDVCNLEMSLTEKTFLGIRTPEVVSSAMIHEDCLEKFFES